MALDTVLALLFCLKTEVFHCYELNLIFRMTSSFQACVRYRGSNRTPLEVRVNCCFEAQPSCPFAPFESYAASRNLFRRSLNLNDI